MKLILYFNVYTYVNARSQPYRISWFRIQQTVHQPWWETQNNQWIYKYPLLPESPNLSLEFNTRAGYESHENRRDFKVRERYCEQYLYSSLPPLIPPPFSPAPLKNRGGRGRLVKSHARARLSLTCERLPAVFRPRRTQDTSVRQDNGAEKQVTRWATAETYSARGVSGRMGEIGPGGLPGASRSFWNSHFHPIFCSYVSDETRISRVISYTS